MFVLSVGLKLTFSLFVDNFFASIVRCFREVRQSAPNCKRDQRNSTSGEWSLLRFEGGGDEKDNFGLK